MTDESNNKSLTLINDLATLTEKVNDQEKILNELICSSNLKKILKKTNTSIKDLKFITLEQFIQQNELSINHDLYSDSFDYHDRYETELQRRITQLKILLDMEHRHFDNKNTSSKKSSRAHPLTPKQLKYSNIKNNEVASSKKERNVKFSANNELEDLRNAKSKRSSHSRKISTSSSRFTRQNSNINLQSQRKIKEVEIFETYTEGRPYIEEYCNQVRLNMDKNEYERLKTTPVTSSSRKRECCNQIGKITKQTIVRKTEIVQNEYQNSPHSFRYQKEQNYWQKHKEKNNNQKGEKNLNEYDMIPLKNEKIKAKLSQKFSKSSERQACKELITEVKRYEEINKNCIKKLKSIDKNDVKSREKILQITSREKIIKKDNIEKLKDRITSKHQKNI